MRPCPLLGRFLSVRPGGATESLTVAGRYPSQEQTKRGDAYSESTMGRNRAGSLWVRSWRARCGR